MAHNCYSNGKLLLTAEYGVLDGATALAVPAKFGQNLKVTKGTQNNVLLWKSIAHNGAVWFSATLRIDDLQPISQSDEKMAQRLSEILTEAKRLNPNFLDAQKGIYVETQLDFDRNWGLGTSSTLINNISNWANIDPYQLLEKTFGGSGYDIACAQHDTSILYTLEKGRPKVTEISFNPPFTDSIYFVYLNKKQDSRAAIKNYKSHVKNSASLVKDLTDLTFKILETQSLTVFQSLLETHEQLLSNVLQLPAVKSRLFNDYDGAIKSLGGWGGDFIMAAGNEKTPFYFKEKGFSVVISFKDMMR